MEQAPQHAPSRRRFLAGAAALTLAEPTLAGAGAPPSFRARAEPPSTKGRKPLAVLASVYYPLSHAYHIAGRFLHGYPWEGKFHLPKQYVHSVMLDQVPANDVSADLAKDFGFRRVRTVAEALLADDKLAIEGVLLIAEHGNYPTNDRGQILYPRYELFEQVVKTFRKVGRTVPVFVDKHLSVTWAKAKQMVAWARDLKFGLMAGSSLPVTWRRPALEFPLDVPLTEALVATYAATEVYGFHGLEMLQVMAERRKGGETGVKSVTALKGPAVWKAGDAGKWSWDLLEAALGRSETLNPGDIRRNVGVVPRPRSQPQPPRAFLVEYRDGFRGTVLLLDGQIQDFCFAARVKGREKPESCLFYLPPPPGAKFFDPLVHHIETFLEAGRPSSPIERTLLTTGTLEAAMESLHRGGERVETPELAVRYRAPAESGFARGSVAAPV